MYFQECVLFIDFLAQTLVKYKPQSYHSHQILKIIYVPD